MQADELLQRYRDGERNFQGTNLRDADLRGADLAGADFSACDLQGANFARANLAGARFCAATAGLSQPWTVALALGGILLVGILSLVVVAFATTAVAYLVTGVTAPATTAEPWGAIALYLVSVFTFAIAAVRKGMSVACELLVAAVVGVCALVFFATAALMGLSSELAASSPPALASLAAASAATSQAGFTAIVVTILPLLGMAAAVSAGVFAGAVAEVGVVPNILVALVALAGAVVGAILGAIAASVGIVYGGGSSNITAAYWWIAIGVPSIGLLLGIFLGVRSLQGDARDGWLRYRALSIASIFGTRFTQANLTDADFSGATLGYANFRSALCDRACFGDARQLHLACGYIPAPRSLA